QFPGRLADAKLQAVPSREWPVWLLATRRLYAWRLVYGRVPSFRMPPSVTLDGHSLSIADVVAVARGVAPVTIAPQALASVAASRRAVETAVGRGDTIYGVNTGFGKLAHVRIKPDQARDLQLNLSRSHAS